MKDLRSAGFTLIELLTVIAIIAILASMVFIVGPRMIEKTKIASFGNTCNQLRTALVGYLTSYARSSYPPGYGFVMARPVPPVTQLLDKDRYWLTPYMLKLKWFRNFDAYDNFSEGYDTDNDGAVSLLEFSPIGMRQVGTDNYDFPTERYLVANTTTPVYINSTRTFGDELREMKNEKRPIAYIPINTAQYRKVLDYYIGKNGLVHQAGREREAFYMERWYPDVLPSPYPIPMKYDDYVLIGVGPMRNSGGLLTPPDTFMTDLRNYDATGDSWYNILAIRAYFLATRDMDTPDWKGDGEPDFDFRSRSQGESANPAQYVHDGTAFASLKGQNLNLYLLPDGTNGGGPLIYKPKT